VAGNYTFGMAKRKADAPPDPDKLVRQSAGSYRTADDRFEARQAAQGWFLVDGEQANEFGQELMHGPFATLKELREAIPNSRAAKTVALPKPTKRSKDAAPTAEPKKPKPPSWIDKLPPAEARAVRKTMAALERQGITDGELLVRRDRDGLLPAVAVRLIERRLAEAGDGPSPKERKLIARVAEILSAEGRATDALPGWTLVEVPPGGDVPPDHRRIDLRT
jgi:hypothetical protein